MAVLLVLSLTTDMYKMRYIKHRTETYSEYETWNAFSRVSAFSFGEDRNAAQILPMKDPSEKYKGAYPTTKMLDIDGAAWTPMMGYNGNPASIQFLRDSVLYVVHAIRPNSRVLVIGTGGGRDLLAAVAYGQSSILGIEINPLMHHIVAEHYREYSGNPYAVPGVEVGARVELAVKVAVAVNRKHQSPARPLVRGVTQGMAVRVAGVERQSVIVSYRQSGL